MNGPTARGLRRAGTASLLALPILVATAVFLAVAGSASEAAPTGPSLFLPDPLAGVPDPGHGPFRREPGRDATKEPSPPYSESERQQLVEEGRELFFSTTAFGQQPSKGLHVAGERLSCATCHSGPGFADNRTHTVGPTGNRELVARQTPHLMRIKDSGPFGWDGRNPTIAHQSRGAITSPLEMNASREPTRRELDALAAFIETIEPPPAVPGVDFDPTLAREGERLFREKRGLDPSGEFSPNVKISCETCHTGPLLTDNKPHRILAAFGDPADPGAIGPNGEMQGFDTPPLVGLRFTAPYFHDGLAGDPTSPSNLLTGTDFARRALRENVLNFYNARFAFNFTNAELDALTEFLLSL